MRGVPVVVVEVMPRDEVDDPQGRAVAGALARDGLTAVSSVRQGKRFELTVDGPVDEAVLEQVRAVAEGLLANPVVESWRVVADPPA